MRRRAVVRVVWAACTKAHHSRHRRRLGKTHKGPAGERENPTGPFGVSWSLRERLSGVTDEGHQVGVT